MRKPPRKRVVVFRVDDAEYGSLEARQKKSAARTISDYCRSMVLENPALVALQSAIRIADEAFAAWDADNDMRCGKILRALGDPKAKGYRADIDAIHEVIARAG